MTAENKAKLQRLQPMNGFNKDADIKKGEMAGKNEGSSYEKEKEVQLEKRSTNGASLAADKMVTQEKIIQKGEEVKQEVSDSWITAKVKSTFLYSSQVDGMEIKVETKDGAVTLSGHTNSGAKRQAAIDLARKVQGVTSINANNLRV